MVRTAVDSGSSVALPSANPANYRLDIQGLRGLAVVLVVLYHSTSFVPGGFIGVDVFFVISGYVIAGLLRTQYLSPGGKPLRTFYARRVRRLLPMLALTVSVTAVLGVLFLSPLGASATTSKTAIAATLLNANTFLSRQAADYFALPPEANALLHTWSLSVEEQFYLFFPGLLVAGAAVLRRRRRRHPESGNERAGDEAARLLAPLSAVTLVSYGTYAFMLGGGGGQVKALSFSSPVAVAFYSAPTRAWEFLVGVLLALWIPRMDRQAQGTRGTGRSSAAAAYAGIGLVLGCALLFTEASGRSPFLMMLPVIGTALLLVGGMGKPNLVTATFTRPRAVWLGDLSYGWYLFHWPLIVFTAANTSVTWAPFVAALSGLGLAVLAKRLVEDRYRFDQSLAGGRAALLAGVCIVVPIVVGAAALVADRAFAVDDLVAANARHADSDRGCNRWESPRRPLDSAECTWSVARPKGKIVLLGDSHAAMWTEAIVKAGNRLGYDVVVATMSACPMIADTEHQRNGELYRPCTRFVDEMLNDAVAMRPSLVMLGAGTTGVLSDREPQRWRRRGSSWATELEDVAATWKKGLAGTVGRLAAVGVPTVIIEDVPYHPTSNETCGRLRFMLWPGSCASTVSRSAYESDRELGRTIDRAVAASEGARTMDPAPWLCTSASCSTFLNETWGYRDGDHLSVAGSESLAPEVERYLRSAGL